MTSSWPPAEYYYGEGRAADYEKAVQLQLYQAADQGHTGAQTHLGMFSSNSASIQAGPFHKFNKSTVVCLRLGTRTGVRIMIRDDGRSIMFYIAR